MQLKAEKESITYVLRHEYRDALLVELKLIFLRIIILKVMIIILVSVSFYLN